MKNLYKKLNIYIYLNIFLYNYQNLIAAILFIILK